MRQFASARGARVHGRRAPARACSSADSVACVGVGARRSPSVVASEMERCYSLVERCGRGIVWLGSSRAEPAPAGAPAAGHYERSFDLAQRAHALLGGTAWSGAGPGLMRAVSEGAVAAGRPAAGFKILFGEAQQAAGADGFQHPYLSRDMYEVVEFFSARKHGLVDAGVRHEASERTAFVCLPGGLGTLDEFFEVVCLSQLSRLEGKGSSLALPPCLLMNYDGCYDGVEQLVRDAERFGYLKVGEAAPHFEVCRSNDEAIALLADFYGL